MNIADFVDCSLARQDRMTLPSGRVTVAEAFRTSFAALLKARFNDRGVELTRASGISSATISKMLSGERGARFDMLDKLRVAFNVTPAGLFDPDASLSLIGLQRRDSDANPGTGQKLDSGPHTDLQSPSPNSTDKGGSAAMHHPDRELLTALLAYWDDLSPEARLELVGHGRRLRTAASAASADASTPTGHTVGFRRA